MHESWYCLVKNSFFYNKTVYSKCYFQFSKFNKINNLKKKIAVFKKISLDVVILINVFENREEN